MCWVMPPASPAITLVGADGVQELGLAVVDVTHDGDDRGPHDQVGLAALVLAELQVEGLQQLAVLVLRGHDLDVEVQLLAQQAQRVVIHRLRRREHLAELEHRGHEIGRRGVDPLGEVRQRGAAGQPDDRAVAAGQPDAAQRRRRHVVELLALGLLGLAAAGGTAARTAERARRATATRATAGTTARAAAGTTARSAAGGAGRTCRRTGPEAAAGTAGAEPPAPPGPPGRVPGAGAAGTTRPRRGRRDGTGSTRPSAHGGACRTGGHGSGIGARTGGAAGAAGRGRPRATRTGRSGTAGRRGAAHAGAGVGVVAGARSRGGGRPIPEPP